MNYDDERVNRIIETFWLIAGLVCIIIGIGGIMLVLLYPNIF
jgi:hypothetical protein